MKQPRGRIFIECSHVYRYGHNTGIQRVVRNFVTQGAVQAARAGVDFRPVIVHEGAFVEVRGLDDVRYRAPPLKFRHVLDRTYLKFTQFLARLVPGRRAQQFILAHRSQFGLARLLYAPLALVEALGVRRRSAAAEPPAPSLRFEAGDVLFLADSSWGLMNWQAVAELRQRRVTVVGLMFDIIPLTHPAYFQPQLQSRFAAWFEDVVGRADGFICISDFTRQELLRHCAARGLGPRCEVVHLGHEIVARRTASVRHPQLRAILQVADPVFLCVGTIEPRKNHRVLLEAFESLWAAGSASRLLLIGRYGWLCDDLAARVRGHALNGQRLHWLEDVDDEDLDHAYRCARAVVVPSFVEGFGLPVVEGLAMGKPVLASDIPVFREIAGGFAEFFAPDDAAALAALLRRAEAGQIAAVPGFIWPSWQEASGNLLSRLQSLAGTDALPAQAQRKPDPERSAAS